MRTTIRHHKARWIKATFIKKFSRNVFQICVGNVETMAHKTQIRISKTNTTWQRPNVLVRREDGDGQDSVLRIPDVEPLDEEHEPEAPRGGRKRRRPVSSCDPVELRRSKRSRKSNRKDDYYYI